MNKYKYFTDSNDCFYRTNRNMQLEQCIFTKGVWAYLFTLAYINKSDMKYYYDIEEQGSTGSYSSRKTRKELTPVEDPTKYFVRMELVG